MKPRVHKFGGASVKDAESVRNMAMTLKGIGPAHCVIVVSAMDKMTNALERLTKAYVERSAQVDDIFEEIRSFHWGVASQLFDASHEVFAQINDYLVEIQWVLEDEPQDPYDYLYDQMVSVGEFLSTIIVSAFLNDSGLEVQWLDVRDVLKTDNAHREARVDWEWTNRLINEVVAPALAEGKVLLTQGFVGCTSENFTSTLGREGSDYTGAIFASCLDASELIIWKDVPGILSADPKQFADVQLIERMGYREAIEMTYYGAKVIHPKTIKPLQNKSIPLYVKSFADPAGPGTWIGTDLESILPPVIVLAEEQALVHISTKDFSFVAEHHLSELFGQFAELRIKINLMRNTAISFSVCCNDEPSKLKTLAAQLGNDFKVVVDRDLRLLTVRHANAKVLEELFREHTVVMEERFKDTVQCVVKHMAVPKLR